MKIIVLDFYDGKVKIIKNIKENIQMEEAEDLLYKKYNFKMSNIEFMIVPDLKMETLK